MPHTTTFAKHSPRVTRPPSPRRSLARFVRVLQAQLPELSHKYQVQSLGVFGSYARREEKPSSDLDILVEFQETNRKNLFQEFELRLSELLGVQVELTDATRMRRYTGKHILQQVIWLQKDGVVKQIKLRRQKRHANGKHNGANMEPKREYLDSLQDMLDSMEKVQCYVAGITLEEMERLEEKLAAVRYELLTIGEAAQNIPDEIRAMYPNIPWKQIIGNRHVMAHGYHSIDYEKVWETIHDSIPRDEPLVAQMLDAEKKRRGVDESNG